MNSLLTSESKMSKDRSATRSRFIPSCFTVHDLFYIFLIPALIMITKPFDYLLFRIFRIIKNNQNNQE